ncbi:MAG TPA: hypothetical protein VFJ15_09030 [Oleiagrimonas sp.]|nr:hypothetical protein [Oleiagrimonas sp.]
MKQHWDFLKESDKSFGLFYPLHYTVAAFNDIEQAEDARNQFLAEGFGHDDVATLSGAFLVNKLESQDGASWLDKLRAHVAEVLGTEAGYLDDDVQLAQHGGAFLFVYTPSEKEAAQVRALIRLVKPVFARRYHHAGIERMRYPPQVTL